MRRSNDDIDFVRAQNANLIGVLELLHETIKQREEELDTWVITDHARSRLERALEVSEKLAGRDFLDKVKQIAADLESADKYLKAVEAFQRACAEALPPNAQGKPDTSAILSNIQRLRTRHDELESLLQEAHPLVIRVPGSESLYARIHQALEHEDPASADGAADSGRTGGEEEARSPSSTAPTPEQRKARQYRDLE